MPVPSESWESIGTRFARALLRPRRAPPLQIVATEPQGLQRRYDIYRNNVTVKLIDALAAIFPAVERITGADFFRAMARFYIRQNLPRSPLLFAYGQTFPDFIAGYQHARSMPWLADIARIERAWLDSYHAQDAPPLEGHHLRSIPPHALFNARLVAHPAMRILSSAHPACSIFNMNRGTAVAHAVADICPEDTLITRPGLAVEVVRLGPGLAQFLRQLAAGVMFGPAAAALLDTQPHIDLPGAIALLVTSGAFTSVLEHS